MFKSLYVGLDGRKVYIYVWVSKKEKLIYVGQTKGKHGVIGRARQHVGEDGTLRINLLKRGYQMERIDDFLLLSFPLPQGKLYPDYRKSEVDFLAVENLVETKCYFAVKNRLHCDYIFVSETTPTNANKMAINSLIADKIVDEVIEIIKVS